VRIAHAPAQLERRPRAVAIGTFDGVHRGHRSVLRAAVESGLEPTVITLDPHPRIVLGNRVGEELEPSLNAPTRGSPTPSSPRSPRSSCA